MDVEKAIESEIGPKLRDAFGLSTTRSLLTQGTLSYITTVGGQIQRYRAFVDTICTDGRVIEEWGEATAARQCSEWKDLVPLEPETVVVLTSRQSG